MSAGPGLSREEAELAARLRRQWPVSGPSDALDQAVLARAAAGVAGRRRPRARLTWLLASAAAAVLAVGTVLRLAAPPGPEPADRTPAAEVLAEPAPGAPAAAPAAREAVASGGADADAPAGPSPQGPPRSQPAPAAERQRAAAASPPPPPPAPPAVDLMRREAPTIEAAAEAELAAAVALLEAGRDAEAAAAARALLRRWPEIELPEGLRALLAGPPPTE